MQALSVIGATMIGNTQAPLNTRTGGTSKSDPNAGSNTDPDPAANRKPITTKDKAGAGILTVLLIVGIVAGSVWLIM
jgi:mannan endo-1,6-alpha-mannosidase